MTIFKILSNLNHNGTHLTPGQFVEEELEHFATLVSDGIVKVIEGAESLEHATKLDAAAEAAAAEAKPEGEAAVAPKDTWGAKKEEVAAAPAAGTVEAKPEDTEQKPVVGAGDVDPDAEAAAKAAAEAAAVNL